LHQNEIGFPGSIPFISEIHVKEGPCDIPPLVDWRFPGIDVDRRSGRFWMGWNPIASSLRVGSVVPLVTPGGIGVGIAGPQIVKIGIGRLNLIQSVGIRPQVLTIPPAAATKRRRGQAKTTIDQDDLTGIPRVGIELSQGIGGIQPGTG
jgi:hypothetical protein